MGSLRTLLFLGLVSLVITGCGGGSSADSPTNTIGFSYYDAGDLEPGTGSGVNDLEEYSPTMRFPVNNFEAYLNSQVNSPGGGAVGGDQCDDSNYDYPWRDTFCEHRSGAARETRNCPSTAVHQGVDIRGGTTSVCSTQRSTDSSAHATIEIVAPEDGYISYIGSYTVNVTADGRIYRLMHMNMDDLQVALFDDVSAGQVVGYLSNSFGGTSTTLHVHFEIKQNIDGEGFTYVSPYMSLVRAYERQYGVTGDKLD